MAPFLSRFCRENKPSSRQPSLSRYIDDLIPKVVSEPYPRLKLAIRRDFEQEFGSFWHRVKKASLWLMRASGAYCQLVLFQESIEVILTKDDQ
jgi:hypothetical protein